MFHRIDQYDLMEMGGRWYRPRAYGNMNPDGTWDGWLVFFPLGGGPAIAADRETTQSSHTSLVVWATGLTPTYLEGALLRALRIAAQPPMISQLSAAEYEALDDAERLETAAEIERTAAVVDEQAAADARADAERLARERLAAESRLAAMEEAAAQTEAETLERAAQDARTVAADASRRKRTAQARAKGPKRSRGTS